MNKIPTLFARGPNFGVIPEVTPGCEWVIDGSGIATEKMDGINIRLTVEGGALVKVEKRRNPTALEKAGGAELGYVDTNADDPADKWLLEAARNVRAIHSWPDGQYSCEAIGPKIQGNDFQLTEHRAMRLDWHFLPLLNLRVVPGDVEATFNLLREQFQNLQSQFMPHSGILAEGCVWWSVDGTKQAKLKRRDFR